MFRVFVVAPLLALGLVWTVLQYNGLVAYRPDPYQCLYGKRWYAAVDKQRLFAVGRVSVYYWPLTYGCEDVQRFDPAKYHKEFDRLVPN